MGTPETERAGQLHAGAPERELRLVEGAALAIGSAPDNDLGMGNPLLAPHHARLERVGGRLRLTDLAGGDVLVNDTPISAAAWHAPGDTVRIGRLRLTVASDAVRYRDPAGTLLIG
jgi:pSer/pThr/pTyr-binding forkhead associated (FHA) protein